jgi:hypothetical protein
MLNGFLGGATQLLSPQKVISKTSRKAAKKIEDNLADWTVKEYSGGKDWVAVGDIFTPLNRQNQPKPKRPIKPTETDIKASILVRHPIVLGENKKSVRDKVFEALKKMDITPEEFMHGIKKRDYDIKHVLETPSLPLLPAPKKARKTKLVNMISDSHPTKKYLKMYPEHEELFIHPLLDYALSPNTVKKGSRNHHISVNKDGSRTVTKKDISQKKAIDESHLTEKMKERIKKGKGTKNDLKRLDQELKRMEADTHYGYKKSIPFSLLFGGLALSMIPEEADASTGEREGTYMDALVALGLGVLAYKHKKGLSKINRALKRRREKSKTLKTPAKKLLSPREMMGVVGGTKFFNRKLKALDDTKFRATKKLGESLLTNIQSLMEYGATKEAVSQTKELFKNRMLADLFYKLTPAFEEWKVEKGFKSLNPLKHVKMKEKFYRDLGEAFTKKDTRWLSKSQQKAYRDITDFFTKFRLEMEKAGVDGISEMELISDYFPRYHNPKTYDYVLSLGEKDKKKVIEWYGEAIRRGFKQEMGKDITNKQAEAMASRLIKNGGTNDYTKMVKEDNLFPKGLEEGEEIDDYFSRAKFRIPIDFNIKPIKVEDNERLLVMSEFIETNAFAVINRYANMASGHYAFAKSGIPNINNYIKHVQEEFAKEGGDKGLFNDMMAYTDIILGKPVTDISDSSLHDFFSLLSKATTAQLLHLSGLSALSEVIPATVRAFKEGALGEALETFKKSSKEMLGGVGNLTEEIATLAGYGEKRVIGKEVIANPKVNSDDMWTIHGGFTANIDRFLTAQQKVTFFLNQLPALEDFANLASLKSVHNKLKMHIEGTQRFNKRRAETLGLNKEAEEILASAFRKTDNNTLNINKWTEKEKQVYTTVIRALQTANVGTQALGDMHLFILKSPLLKALSTLMSFPLQSLDNLLLRDIYARDAEAIFRFQAMFASTALSVALRDTITQREDKGDYLERVVSSLPHFAMLNIASSIFKEDGASMSTLFPSLSVLENVINTPISTLEGDYKPLLQTLSVPLFLGKMINATAQPPKTDQEAIEQLGATIGGLK